MPSGQATLPFVVLASLIFGFAGSSQQSNNPIEIGEGKFFHLGDDLTPEWNEAPAAPTAAPLSIEFKSPAAQGDNEWLLELTQRSIDNQWSIYLNDIFVDYLDHNGDPGEFYYSVPPGLIKKGNNELKFSCDKTTDDITIGNIRLHRKSAKDFFQLGSLRITVVNKSDQSPVPCRITIEAKDGSLPNIYYPQSKHIAVRPGVVYPYDGECEVMVPKGDYTVWASRGMEWGVDSKDVRVSFKGRKNISLGIETEVDTSGYVAADTHIHTLTHSGHGDSSVEERQLTLAGEGVELAIATDHNHNIDYAPTQRKMGLSEWFTPVVGNEVSTPIGHFNAFPLDPNQEVPRHKDYKTQNPDDWVKVCQEMRNKGAEVIILNHPRWPDFNEGPWGKLHLNQVTGERDNDTPFDFDAFELFNSTTPHTALEELLKDWFAILNYGEQVVAVGSSDSHTVGDMVGQGRTYVKSSATNASNINVLEAAESFANGNSSAALGFFIDVTQNGYSLMGHQLNLSSDSSTLDLTVAGASWARPETLTMWVNGAISETIDLSNTKQGPWRTTRSFEVPNHLKHDAWIVFTLTGPLPEGGFWQTLMPHLGAATNPIWIDADGDGKWSSPRQIAQNIIKNCGLSSDEIALAIRKVDDAVATQVFAIVKGISMDEFEELGSRKHKHKRAYERVEN